MSSEATARPNGPAEEAPPPQTPADATRLDDGIYQNNRLVARVLNARVDQQAREIRIDEVYHSDDLLMPDEFEYQKYRALIQKVVFASRVDREAPHKGRVLRGVVAEILGYREQ